jgi:hypothetical protein
VTYGCWEITGWAAADVEQVLTGSQPHLMVTDPPYGVGYNPSWRASDGHRAGKLAQGKVLNDDRADWRQAYALFPGDAACLWYGAMHSDIVAAGLAACGFQLRAQIVWAKQHFTLSRGDYHWKHECCWYAVREGKTSHWQGDRTQTTIWGFPNNNPFGSSRREESWGHGAQKPVEAMRRPIVNNSRPGELVYDPILGSGTSLIAGRDDRPHLLRSRDQPQLRRCHPATLASLYRVHRRTPSIGSIVRRARREKPGPGWRLRPWREKPLSSIRRSAKRCAIWLGSGFGRTTSPRLSAARPRPCASGVVTTSIAASLRPMRWCPAICSPPLKEAM